MTMHPMETPRIPRRLSPLITYRQKIIVPTGVYVKFKLRWIIAAWPTVAVAETRQETKATVINASHGFNDVGDPIFMRTF